ncbi:glycerophosphodiester phosphodiesterase [Acidocella sp.]|uniref:glycerophosphodiester phosphodiesterase n=1 Tax=Acidocella sp. TaxID=50710 RepID=UPI002F40DCD7
MREQPMATIYGHRGARAERPENTIEGFVHAVARGVAGIETDIALSADFCPVLHHDPEFSDGRRIKDLPRSELPPEVPTLEAALNRLPDIEWLLEIKTFPDAPERSHPPELVATRVLEVLEKAPAQKIVIFVFDWAVLRAVAAGNPALRRVCLTAPKTAQHRNVWWGPGFDGMSIPQAVAATGAWGWAAEQKSLSQAEIDEAHELGLKIFAWTVNERQDFDRLAPWVDGIITDHPSRFLA